MGNMTLRCLRAVLAAATMLLPCATFGAGALDASFGIAGRAVFDFTPQEYQGERGVDLAVQPDGKLVVASETTNNNTVRVIVSRHLANGSLDAAFGTAGKVVLDFGACAQCYVTGPKLALLGNGSIIVAAGEQAVATQPNTLIRNIVVTRLTPAGSVDAAFGNAGVARVNPEGNTALADMAVQADGRVVLAGATGSSAMIPGPPSDFPISPMQSSPMRWLVTRLDASGAHDPTFQDGAGPPHTTTPSVAQRIGIQSDGRIVVMGSSNGVRGFRYNADGSLANAIGTGLQGGVLDLAIDGQDRVWVLDANNTLVRWGPDLTGTTGFGSPILPNQVVFLSVAPLPGGGAYLVGAQLFTGPQGMTFSTGSMIVKVDSLGTLDLGFADRGVLSLNGARLTHIVVQQDGRPVATGAQDQSPATSGMKLVLARVDPAATAFVATEWMGYPLQSLGTHSDPQFLTVTNTSGATRQVSVSPSANFEVSGCGGSLSPGASCTAVIIHHPTSTGALFGFFEYSEGSVAVSDDGGSSATIKLYASVERSLVRHFYRTVLGRAADADGARFWNAEARRIRFDTESLSGATVQNSTEAWFAMAMAFFRSSEYAARNSDDTTYILHLYSTFFDRAGDGPGVDFWRNQMAQGLPREMLLTAFMFSPEFASFNSQYFGGTANRPEIDLVMDMYRGLLGRLPDRDGLRHWVGRMQAAQCLGAASVRAEADAVSAQFAYSAEYSNRARSHAQQVADLYNAFLRRAGDAEGFQHWKTRLDNGTLSREDVRQAFMQSSEFGARVQAVINAGCRQGG